MIRILIADDHTIVRHGLKQIVDAGDGMMTVGEARNGNEVMQFVRSETVDVVLLDIAMPGRNGLETLKELRREQPSTAVIVLSMHPKDQYAVRVIRAGAAAYLTKEDAPEELVTAIRKAHRGEKYITPDVAELLAEFVERGAHETIHKVLSDREFEVFREIGMGKSLTRISEELCLSVKTISAYRTRIVEKTGFKSNADITRYCIDNRLV